MRNFLYGVIFGALALLSLGAHFVDGKLIVNFDSPVTLGLTGTEGSIAYNVEEIEHHIHNNARWFGLHASPSGEVTRMQSTDTTSTPFQIDAGDDTWGSWLQIVGSGDTPAQAGMEKFDLHQIEFVDREHNTTTYKSQIACGESGAAALAAGAYTETLRFSGGAQDAGGPENILMPRYDAGTKCWMRIWAVGQNTSTMDFFIGIHEYEG